MLRRFLQYSSVYIVSSALSRGVGILLLPLYTRFLTSTEYGALDLLTVFGTLANYVVALEISQGLARSYADAGSDARRDEYVSSAWWFACVGYLVFLAAVLACSEWIAITLLGASAWSTAVDAMGCAMALNGIFFLMQDLLRWQLRPQHHAYASIGYTAVSAGTGASLVVFAKLGVPGILYGQCAGALVGIGVAWTAQAATHWKPIFDMQRLREMLGYSAPQVLSSLAGYASLSVDRVFIKHFLSLEDLGTYGVGARVASVVALIMFGFQSGLVPLVFKQHADPDTPVQLARVFRYFLTLAAALLLFLCGFARELTWFFTVPAYYDAWVVIPVIATALIAANMYIFVPGIFLVRRTGVVALINIAAALVNVLASVVLIPRVGIVGAASATLAASVFAFSCYVYYNQIHYPVELRWRSLGPALALTLGAASLLVWLQIDQHDVRTVLAPKILVWLAASISVGWTLLDRRELAAAFRQLRKGSP